MAGALTCGAVATLPAESAKFGGQVQVVSSATPALGSLADTEALARPGSLKPNQWFTTYNAEDSAAA